jgi:hypothetical protein
MAFVPSFAQRNGTCFLPLPETSSSTYQNEKESALSYTAFFLPWNTLQLFFFSTGMKRRFSFSTESAPFPNFLIIVMFAGFVFLLRKGHMSVRFFLQI